MIIKNTAIALLSASLLAGLPPSSWAGDEVAVKSAKADASDKAKLRSGYVAKNESIQGLFSAAASEAKKPIILSRLAQKKTVTGDFDLSNPLGFLDFISGEIGLAWYDDGQTIYVYDNSELKNAVVVLRATTLPTLIEFLETTGLYTKRYPIRGESKNNVFYVAGPPAYIDLVVNAAAYLDDLYKNVDLNKQRISVIKLQHTFVSDRKIKVRDQEILVPGIGRVIEAILSNDRRELITLDPVASTAAGVEKDKTAKPADKQQSVNDTSQIKVIPYPDTNSLLIKGTQEQIELIQALVAQLDIPKRHIELSLWIIDINKNDVDQLGIDWYGAINLGSSAQVTVTTTGPTLTSTLDGTKFLLQVTALSRKGVAQIVSRPIILTQDNVPATFDNNSTFYTKVTGERAANLESVTFGTLINVLPRYADQGESVEMVLDIEDGQNANNDVSGLPLITRTKLSTIARVPKDKSLLIGGYTLENYARNKSKIPLLGDIPYIGGLFRSENETTNKAIRLFLIQPRLLEFDASWDPGKFIVPRTLAPQMPLSDTLRLLRHYPVPQDE